MGYGVRVQSKIRAVVILANTEWMDQQTWGTVISVAHRKIVSKYRYNHAVCNADYRYPGLLGHPFCVVKNNDRAKVALYLHSVPHAILQPVLPCARRWSHYFPPIENCSRNVDKLPPDVRGLWYFFPLCDCCEELMDIVLIYQFEVALVRRL